MLQSKINTRTTLATAMAKMIVPTSRCVKKCHISHVLGGGSHHARQRHSRYCPYNYYSYYSISKHFNYNNNNIDNTNEKARTMATVAAFNQHVKYLQRKRSALLCRNDAAATAIQDGHNVKSNNNKNSQDKNPQQQYEEIREGREQQQQQQINNTNNNQNNFYYDYFRQEIASRLVDRLDDIKKDHGFPLALDIGSGPGYLHRIICSDDFLGDDTTTTTTATTDNDDNHYSGGGGIGGIKKLVQLDSCYEMLHRDDDDGIPIIGKHRCQTYKLHFKDNDDDGENSITFPFPNGTFDLVISCGALHWINDLPKLLSEAKRVLKPDGCIMFAMVGGSSLSELQTSLGLAEQEREGGVSPHVGPFVNVSDVGSLLTSAEFTLPTVDVDTISIGFPDAMVVMEHLQRMGEGNACLNRRDRVPRDTFLAACAIYQNLFRVDPYECNGVDAADHDDVKVTIQVIYAIGWTPHVSQQRPLTRGSATQKIKDI